MPILSFGREYRSIIARVSLVGPLPRRVRIGSTLMGGRLSAAAVNATLSSSQDRSYTRRAVLPPRRDANSEHMPASLDESARPGRDGAERPSGSDALIVASHIGES